MYKYKILHITTGDYVRGNLYDIDGSYSPFLIRPTASHINNFNIVIFNSKYAALKALKEHIFGWWSNLHKEKFNLEEFELEKIKDV